MSKSPFDFSALTGQSKGMVAAQKMGQASLTSAQEIAQLNQQAAQELAERLQARVAELMKTQDPKAAFEFVHAEVLQDASHEVAEYQAKLMHALSSGNQKLAKIAESMIQESQQDLIHFVNEATQNAPAETEPFTSVFKTSFNNTLQNFELIRAAMADSFSNFEKSVESMSKLSGIQKPSSTPKKKSSKK
jgi:hypothetical protein